ncbi:hypothetical protein GHT06_000232 [Daphnia sinensis]|uniref:OB domain-containing protein n=1 Tax=Daphnia sinensis TaxID=1820382 RepID=A0AAD5KFV7_9CRUS|nr:hypothetical protein GHT06_005560 [Daphnia sinensis]KAI9551061.1 hypothetical protein GHT06_000232 [Daphnia sinensis]
MIRSDDSDSDSPLCVSTLPSSNGAPPETKRNIYLPLSRLSPMVKERWMLKVQVIRKSREIPISKGSSCMFYMVIQDESGMTTAKAFGKEAEKYFTSLEIGKFFEISHARVVASNSGRNTLLVHPWEIIFTSYTQVTVLEEKTICSVVKFPIIPLGQICRLAEKSVVDVVGYIDKVVGPTALKDGSLRKKEIFIFDASLSKGQNAIVTLWNDDMCLVDGLDVTRHYYKVCILDGRTNLFSQIPSISISAGSVINIAKVEIDSDDAAIITAWKTDGKMD